MKTQNENIAVSQQSPSPLPQGWSIPFTQCGFDFRLHQQGREFEQCRVLVFLKRRVPQVWPVAEVVGGWVWVQHPYSPIDQVCSRLFELGFHWSQRRQLWQHPCGQFSRLRSRIQAAPLRYFPAQVEA
jgi:hypothetical protein